MKIIDRLYEAFSSETCGRILFVLVFVFGITVFFLWLVVGVLATLSHSGVV